MPVIFDEVLASVEAPPATERPDPDDNQVAMLEKDVDKMLTAVETMQRHALRLEAN